MSEHTPGPWEWKDVPGAGLEIFGPVHLVEAVELPLGIPAIPINIFGMATPQNVLLSYERWVQFEPKGWSEMQEANARLIAAAPDLYTLAVAVVTCWEKNNGALTPAVYQRALAALTKADGNL